MHSDSRSALIFDFDGTLVDSLMVSLDTLHQIVHHQPLPIEDVSRLRGMTLAQVLRQLRVSPWHALFLRGRAYKAMAARLNEVELVPDMGAVLRELALSHKLYILSSNSAANIRSALERFKLDAYIVAIHGSANPLNKVSALRQLMNAQHIDPASSWYVGDQAGDVHAAHRAGLRAVAVSWGFSNLHVLEAARPDLLVFTPEELLQHFNGGTYAA